MLMQNAMRTLSPYTRNPTLKSNPALVSAVLSLTFCFAAAAMPAHPRLLVTEDEWKGLHSRMEEQPAVREIIRATTARADAAIAAPPLTYQLTGRRMLSVSRDALQRVLDLSTAWKVSGERRYLDRCRAEMLAVCAFNDWHPVHHLDTAEMQAAVAIGYDWLHADLSDADRGIIETALLEKGLKETFKYKALQKRGNNWNQVCMGGMILSAVALMEIEPELCSKALAEAMAAMPTGLEGSYPPDGAYSEGGGYWQYGTEFAALAIESLRTAGLPVSSIVNHPGFLESGRYVVLAHGSSGLLYNYGDTKERPLAPNPAGAWMARENRSSALLDFFGAPFLRIDERKASRLLALAAFWLPSPDEVKTDTLPLHFLGGGHSPVAFHRTGFGKEDTFLGVKAGKADVPHGHMDAGSFVLDHKGERWAADLGSQDYHSLEEKGIVLFDMDQGSKRWAVFRLNNLSHNTLTYNGTHHRVGGEARIISSKGSPENETLLDISDPLGLPEGAGAQRRFAIGGTSAILTVTDTLTGLKPGDIITWHMATRAEVSSEGDGMILSSGKERLSLALSSPQGGRATARPADPPPASHDEANPGITRITLDATAGNDGKVTVTASFHESQ